MLDAVVEVDFLAQVGVVVDLLLVGVDLVELVLQALELFLVLVLVGLRGSRVDALLVGLDARLVELLLLVDVARAHARHRVAVVAVDVDERLEAVLPACVEEPVDRPLLVGLAVVFVEVVEEVAADVLQGAALAAERIRDELQVLLIVLLAVTVLSQTQKRSTMSSSKYSSSQIGMMSSSSGRNVGYFDQSNSPPA